MPKPMKPKLSPPRGQLPVLQYCAPDQLQIDADYQRSLETPRSEALIRRIAAQWDWGLCQPLFVARRGDGGLFVVDGQHRLAAARIRGDIWQLPCVVTGFDMPAAEAEAFVQLNQQRRPLTALELFKAAVAAGDEEATTIVRILEEAGLKLSAHHNNQLMKLGHVANVGGLRACLRAHGEQALQLSCETLAKAFEGQVLRYAGSIFPGIAAVVADELRLRSAREKIAGPLAEVLGGRSQADWIKAIARQIGEDPTLRRADASAAAVRSAWRARRFGTADDTQAAAEPEPTDMLPAEVAWCDQCDQRVSGARAAACTSPFCSLKAKPAAQSQLRAA